jgi:hypothetical protein
LGRWRDMRGTASLCTGSSDPLLVTVAVYLSGYYTLSAPAPSSPSASESHRVTVTLSLYSTVLNCNSATKLVDWLL